MHRINILANPFLPYSSITCLPAFVTNFRHSPVRFPVLYDCITITVLFFTPSSNTEIEWRNKETSNDVLVQMKLNIQCILYRFNVQYQLLIPTRNCQCYQEQTLLEAHRKELSSPRVVFSIRTMSQIRRLHLHSLPDVDLMQHTLLSGPNMLTSNTF